MLARTLGSERLGNALAILAGDYALSLATELLAKLRVPGERLRELLGCFTEMHEHAVLGQELDISGTSRGPKRPTRSRRRATAFAARFAWAPCSGARDPRRSRRSTASRCPWVSRSNFATTS